MQDLGLQSKCKIVHWIEIWTQDNELINYWDSTKKIIEI
jgi:hypothetical protein